MKPDKYQAPALATWASGDDPLEDQIEHALGQLVAEAGELVGLAVKAKYKPSYQYSREAELAEWGDWWYYCRVSAYLFGWTVEPWLDAELPGQEFERYAVSPEFEIVQAVMSFSNVILEDYILYNRPHPTDFRTAIGWMRHRLNQLGVTVDELTEMNRVKLIGGHGWMGEAT